MKKELFILLLITAFIGYAGSASSEPAEKTDIYELGEIVITGENPGVEAVATKWEITSEYIKLQNVKTLDEALELLPGVNISSRAQGVPRVDLRGMRSRHVVLLLNGIPINSTADGQFNPAIIATDNIAKIKVSYSGSSVLYGQGALGGVINIITKKGTEGLNGSVSEEIDERGNDTTRANIAGGTENFDIFVSGSIKDSDGYRMSEDFEATSLEDGGIRDNSCSERENFFANAGYTINDAWKIGLTLEKLGGEYGSPPAAIDNNMDDIFGKSAKYEQVKDYDGNMAQFSASYDPDNPLALRAWVFYNEYEEERAQYDGPDYITFNRRGNYYTTDTTKVSGWNVQGTYDLEDFGQFTGSLSSEKDKFHTVGAESSRNGSLDEPYDYNYEVDIHSAALEYNILVLSKLNLAAGYSHYWQKRDVGEDDDKGSYLLGADYFITENTSIRASISKKIRFPSLEQLYAPGDEGNQALKPEESMNYELGVNSRLPWDLEVDLVTFLNNVDNYIEKDDDGTNQNNDEYRFSGVELTLRKPFLKTGFVKLGYSYLDSENRSPGALTDKLQYRPENKYTLEGAYTWAFGFTAYASIMHVADQYNIADELTQKLDDFTLVNVKLQQNFLNDRISAYIGATNLFDENYEESYGFPKEGRRAYAGMKFTF